ncbi:MAG: hypothetical protein HYZ62_01770 [Candidatus Andersenbacteria bacterium]|nr:hypothetical protein [Candidatus Andersenbacteria bacterium]
MEYETDDSNKSLADRLRESPRTVSALIIILIVAAAIYAFSGSTPEEAAAPSTTEAAVTSDVPSASPAAEGTVAQEAAPTPAAVTKEEIAATVEALPEARKTETAYIEVAQRGDGITHLARRATARYLGENTVDFTVTNEHRIYIEDYIKDHMQRTPTRIGAEKEISFDLIKDAIESAKTLNEKQLKNLSKYTYALK